MSRHHVDALVVGQTPFTTSAGEWIAALVAKYRLPAIADGRAFSEAGLLLTYSVDFMDPFRKAAVCIDHILKGVRPAHLPIQMPSKYELIINLKTARTLGITIPQSILQRADEVIR